MLWFIGGVCVVIFIIYNVFFSVKLRLQTINFYSGGLGSGKTLKETDTALKLRNWSKLRYIFYGWHPLIIIPTLSFVGLILSMGYLPTILTVIYIVLILLYNLSVIKNVKSIKFTSQVREIYSNYPILIKKRRKVNVYSHILTKEHILGIDKLPERVIVIIDECSNVFPNTNAKSDPKVTTAFRWFRHWTDGTIIMADQSIGDIDITIRRRVNIVYNFSSFRKLFNLVYWLDVNRVNYMEDLVTNVNDINNFDIKFVFGIFGKRKFNSRYMRLFYNPMQDRLNNWSELLIQPDFRQDRT